VLHIEKLTAREAAEQVAVLPTPGKEWEPTHTDTKGEYFLQIALEEWMPYEKARIAAAGWGGDTAMVFANRDLGTSVAAWRIRFDSVGPNGDSEAKEAFDLLASAWSQAGKRVPCKETAYGGHVVLARGGRDIVIAGGSPKASQEPNAASCGFLTTWAGLILSKR
jgi:hypothetical protein